MVFLLDIVQILNAGFLMTTQAKSQHANLSKSELKGLLFDYVRDGDVKEEDKAFKIRCPFHEDLNPSCMVFKPAGNFYCFVCHGDSPKGKRGVSAKKGFMALGMSKEKADSYFVSGNRPDTPLRVNRVKDRLPSLDDFETIKVNEEPRVRYSQVDTREPWPEFWGFRGIHCSMLTEPWFKDRFSPSLVLLKKERYQRLALSIGGSEDFKKTKAKGYMRQEVYLRLSTSIRAKAINTLGLNLDPMKPDPLHATLFGLVDNRIGDGCKGIFLTEGPYDCMNFLSLTHKDPELSDRFECIALLGTPQWGNCRKQIELFLLKTILKKQIPIILAFDNDDAGFKLTKTAITELQELIPASLIKVFNYPMKVEDLGELTHPLLLRGLQKAGLD